MGILTVMQFGSIVFWALSQTNQTNSDFRHVKKLIRPCNFAAIFYACCDVMGGLFKRDVEVEKRWSLFLEIAWLSVVETTALFSRCPKRKCLLWPLDAIIRAFKFNCLGPFALPHWPSASGHVDMSRRCQLSRQSLYGAPPCGWCIVGNATGLLGARRGAIVHGSASPVPAYTVIYSNISIIT